MNAVKNECWALTKTHIVRKLAMYAYNTIYIQLKIKEKQTEKTWYYKTTKLYTMYVSFFNVLCLKYKI